MESNLDGLLSALEERANTARTIFMLLDSDADGLVAVEQVSRGSQQPRRAPRARLSAAGRPDRPPPHAHAPRRAPMLTCAPRSCQPLDAQLGSMLTSMLLSQSLNYDGDVEEFVLQITRHRRLVRAPPDPARLARANRRALARTGARARAACSLSSRLGPAADACRAAPRRVPAEQGQLR